MNNYLMNSAKPNYHGSHKANTALSQQFNTISAAPDTEKGAKNNRLMAENDNALTKSATRDRRADG